MRTLADGKRGYSVWLIRLLEEGVTGRLIDEVNRWTSKIRYRRLLVMNEGEPPQWHEIADLGSGLYDISAYGTDLVLD
jgi:hypothetical protein